MDFLLTLKRLLIDANCFTIKVQAEGKWRQQPGTGILLVCGATSGKQLFDGISLCVRYWFDAIDFEFSGKVVVRGVDKPSAVKKAD